MSKRVWYQNNLLRPEQQAEHERNLLPDEMDEFIRNDQFTFESLRETLEKKNKEFAIPFRHLINDAEVVLMSTEFFEGIPFFMIKIKNDLKFETYYLGSKVRKSTLVH